MKFILILVLTTSSLVLIASDDQFAVDRELNHSATLPSIDCKCTINKGTLRVTTLSSDQQVPILVSTGNTMQEYRAVKLPQKNACVRFLSKKFTLNRLPTTVCCFNFNAPGSHNPALVSALLLQKSTDGVTRVELLTTTSHLSSRIKNYLNGIGIELPQNIIANQPE